MSFMDLALEVINLHLRGILLDTQVSPIHCVGGQYEGMNTER